MNFERGLLTTKATTSVAPTSTTSGPSTSSTTTEKLTTPNPTTEKASSKRTTAVEPTTAGKTNTVDLTTLAVTPEATKRATVPTNVPTPSDSPIETVYTRGISPGNPGSSTPLSPQSSSSPKPHELSSANTGGPNPELTAGIVTGTILGLSFAGLIGFVGYKCVQNYRRKNAAPSDVEASSAQTDNVSYGEYRVSELDYVEEEEERPGVLPSMFSRVRSWFGRNKPNADVTLLNNPVSNASSHSLGTHYKSPNVDIEHNPVVSTSSDSDDSNESGDCSIYEPPVKSNAMPLQDVLKRNQSDTVHDISVIGSGPASSELPGNSGRSSPRI